jgi:hypothetical protein
MLLLSSVKVDTFLRGDQSVTAIHLYKYNRRLWPDVIVSVEYFPIS